MRFPCKNPRFSNSNLFFVLITRQSRSWARFLFLDPRTVSASAGIARGPFPIFFAFGPPGLIFFFLPFRACTRAELPISFLPPPFWPRLPLRSFVGLYVFLLMPPVFACFGPSDPTRSLPPILTRFFLFFCFCRLPKLSFGGNQGLDRAVLFVKGPRAFFF